MRQLVLRVLAGFAWLMFSFFAGLYLTFPSETAKERLVFEFDKANEGEMALEVGGLSLWRLTGVAMTDVQILSLKKGRRTKDNPKPGMEAIPFVRLEDVAARVQLLPLLVGQEAVGFVATALGGTVSGSFSTSPSLTEVEVTARSIDLSQLPVQSGETILRLAGSLEVDADLSLNKEELKESKGSLKMRFPGLGLQEGSKASGFGLPAVVFTKAEVEFEIKDGKLVVTTGNFESPDLTATLTGDVSLNKKLVRSRNRLELLFTLPPNLDELAKIAPEMKRARDDEGKYHASISGTILSPSFRLSRSKGAVGAAALGSPGGMNRDALPPVVMGGGGEGPTDPSEMSDEERKAARQKRIDDRRERLRKRREELEAQRAANAGGGAPDREPPEPEGRSEPYIPPGAYPTPDEMEQQRQQGPDNGPEDGPPPDDGPPDE